MESNLPTQPLELSEYKIEQPYILTQSEKESLSKKHQIFQNLVQEFPYEIGKNASKQERKQRKDLKNTFPSLTYGEIEFLSLGEILYTIENRYGGISGGVFYDLGSGTGKGVLSAALLHPFDQCKGIELLEGLYEISLQIKNRYEENLPFILSEYSEDFERLPSIDFLEEDIFDSDWSDANCILASSTCFSREIMQRIGEGEVRPGTFGISLSKPFGNQSWELLEKVRKNMEWGVSAVFVQRKKDIREPR